MAELSLTDRVIALLEWGDVAEADAEIELAGAGDGTWQVSLWRGTRALMEGRFKACERFAAEAAELGAQAGDSRADLRAGMLVVAMLREQERLAEAEIMMRVLLDRHPAAPASAHALLALLIGEMGRDTQARMELSRLIPRDPVAATGRLALLYLLSELAADVEAPPGDLDLLVRRLRPHARDFAVEDGGAGCYGSVAFALGRLAQARGRWTEAADHYDDALAAHARVGAPLLLAHTQRHLAALLRVHGDESDWERAVALLSAAAAIYVHLGVEVRAAEAQAVLAAEGLPGGGVGGLDAVTGLHGLNAMTSSGGSPTDDQTIFRRQGDAWVIGPPDDTVRLRDAKGLHDIARLLAAPRVCLHVADLLGAAANPVDRATTGRWGAGPVQWEIAEPVLDDVTRHEYEVRLTELAGELVEAERASDAVRAALARAERDLLNAALAESDGADPLERARQAVATRIRISLDRIERAQPPVGRHLRMSIRTGTFCSYEPDRPVRWTL